MLVAASAHGYAQARSAALQGEVFAVVICADGAAQVMLIDRDGNPVDPQHCLPEFCSACLSPLALALAPHPVTVSRRAASHRLSYPLSPAAIAVARPASDPRPRGPPATT
jgi:hypothetical protein